MPVVRSSSGGGKTPPAIAGREVQPARRSNVSRQTGIRSRRVKGARKIVSKDLPPFSRQMAAMLGAGMPIVAAMETIEEQMPNPNFRVALVDVRRSIEGGASFSESLQQFPDIFDALYINMVRAGEQSGQFAETMRRIGDLLEANARLKRKVKSAMTYPVVVLSMALIIATGMIIFIVPVFADMYKDFGGQLPGPTQFLVHLSNGIKKYAVVIVPAILGGVWLFKRWSRTAAGAWALDSFALKAPVVGVLVQKVAVARFAKTLSQLVQSGVPILGALEIVAKASGNRVIEKSIMDARLAVEHGDPLSVGLSGRAGIPSIVVRMMAAGEKTGKVDEMLDSVATTFDDEVEAMLASLTSMLEPLLMVFLGIIIGGIVICMFLPIFKMGDLVSKF
jgi:type IV pilus assembly protein PilC